MRQTIVISYTFYGVSGKYSPEDSGKLIFHAAPAFSLSGRTKESSMSQTPGNVLYLVSAEDMGHKE